MEIKNKFEYQSICKINISREFYYKKRVAGREFPAKV